MKRDSGKPHFQDVVALVLAKMGVEYERRPDHRWSGPAPIPVREALRRIYRKEAL